MNKINFLRKSETSQLLFQAHPRKSLSRGVVLVSFWLLSICSVWSQTAPNINYATPNNYLLNASITPLAPVNTGGIVPALTYQRVSTFAGTATGFLDGIGTAAKMDGPLGMKMAANGDIYFIDGNNFRIRKLNTQTGAVTTIAGDGYNVFFAGRLRNDTNGALASFNYPTDLAIDAVNNCLYVADKENDVIRKVSLVAPYAVTTFAGSGTSSSVDGTGLAARFKKPSGIVIDPTGTFLYVTDRAGNKIRRITISTAVVTTIAGSGTQSTVDNTTGTTATFNDPTGIAVDANFIYVTDFGGHKIRKIANTSPFTVTTLAGSGTRGTVDNTTGALATFDNPYGITLDPAGNLYVAEWGNKIRKITAAGAVTTFAGSGASSSIDGIGTAATFDGPSHIVINPTSGVGYVSEWLGDRIRKIELGGYVINPTPALPTGINFDTTTGTFSGTPTAINNGPKDYTIRGYNYYGSSTATVTIATGTLPLISATTAVTSITSSSATSGGNVTRNGLTTLTGDAPLLEKGICWSSSANPTILDSKLADSNLITGSFTSNITGLTPLTTYFARAYATNVLGTAYGTQVSFTTPIAPPDISYSASNVFTLNTAITPLQVTNAGGLIPSQFKDNVTTFAGSDFVGSTDGVGVSATFNFAAGVGLALDASGNLYVGDSSNHKIRKITPAGVVSTFAGSGTAGFNDASGALASFSEPIGVTVGSTGTVYVADKNNARIRAITSAGAVSTVAGTGNEGATDGWASVASFTLPTGVALDESIGVIYVAEKNSHKIRAVDLDGGVFTYAGNGTAGSINATGAAASFNSATEVAVDATGNVFVSDVNNNRIRKITRDRAVTTHAGGIVELVGSQYSLWNPRGVAVDAAGNVYVADKFNHKIRKITPAGVVITLAGGIQGTTDGSIANARFDFPEAVAVGTDGTLYIADRSRKIRKIVSQGYSITPALPLGLVFNADGSITGTPTVASPATAYTITAANAGGSSSFTVNIAVVVSPPAISYTTTNQFTAYTAITALQATNTGGVIPSQLKGTVSTFAGSSSSGSTDGAGNVARFNYPNGVSVDAAGNVYVSDTDNHKIRKITPTGVVSTLAGSGTAGNTDGPSATASFWFPRGLAVDAAGNVYVADRNNNKIRKISPDGHVSTLAGSGNAGYTDAAGTAASFFEPNDVTIDAAGNVYVADSNNHKIRKISSSGIVTTLAGSEIFGSTNGTGTSASFYGPRGVAVDAVGNIFVSDSNNNLIRKITPAGEVSTLAGSGQVGSIDGTGAAASFNAPRGLAVDANGNVYVSERSNHKIRKITPEGVVSTLAGRDTNGSTNGTGAVASFNQPTGVAIDAIGNIFIADSYNKQIRKITNEGYSITPALPAGLVLNANGSITGTPTVGSPATNYTITATNAGGSSTSSISIEVLNVPVISTAAVYGITAFGATSGIMITSSGSLPVTAFGICWSLNTTPTIADSYNNVLLYNYVPVVPTSFPSIVYTSPQSTYYVRAYLTNSAGTVYGNTISFVSGVRAPVISYTTTNVFSVNTAITPLQVSNTGGAAAQYTVTPDLPVGLVLNANGSITGIPTVVSPATNYTITATNAGGSASFTISIAVNAVASIATWTGSQWINQNLLNTVNPAIIEGEFTPSTSFEVGSLTIKNNAIVNVNSGINLTVNGKLTVEPGSTLTLDSNANLLQTTDVTNSGLISINRNTAPLKLLDYVLWSSPVSDQQLQSFSSATLSNRFYTYNAGTNLYNAVADPSTTLFATGKGYLIRMPNNHPLTPTIWKGTFTGVPNNGTVNLSVTSGTYNAIGNPYPSTIDTNAFIDANGITEALYFWRKTNNSDNPSYASYTKAGGIATALAADPNGLVPNGVLQVGQGFIVKSASNAISFTNAMRTANNGNQFLRTKNDNKSRIWLNLTNASGFFSQTMVAYMDGATSGIDAAIDGRYFNDCPTALTSIITNEEFSIQGRSLPFDTSDVVPLGFKTETAGEFSLAIDHTDGLFAAGQKVFLQDKVTNTVNDLSIGTYKFTTDAGVFNSRFALMYQNTLSIDDADALSNQVMVYKQNEKISIDAGSIIMEAVKVYDLNGRLLFDRNNINANQFAFSIATATDVLLIKMTSTDGKVISKKIIN